jgi:cystathionine beta-lyase/cystathionine gamma-synthase
VSRSESERPAEGVRTRAVHGPNPPPDGAMSSPVVHSSTFGADSLDDLTARQNQGPAGSFYQRYGHPTLGACEQRLAQLDGVDGALLFSSGMAAISTVFLTLLRQGDHVIALDQCYGGTITLLNWGAEHCGWQVTMVDAREPATWPAAFRPNTRLFHVESPTNPTLRIVDLTAAAALAHERGALLSVDNTFASPIGQQAHALGVDVVEYSATKSIGGHGDLLAGVVTARADLIAKVYKTRKIFGPVPDPALAWQIERSLKTLPLRLEAMNANALELAKRLTQHPSVLQVFHPGLPAHPGHDIATRQMRFGFGQVVAFEVRGGAAAAQAVVESLKLVRHGPSLGGVDSLVSLPSHTSHIMLGPEGRAKAGIPEGLVRLSAGIEDAADLWADLEQAIAKVPSAVG